MISATLCLRAILPIISMKQQLNEKSNRVSSHLGGKGNLQEIKSRACNFYSLLCAYGYLFFTYFYDKRIIAVDF
ncbi:hypothetical protein [Piscirickettsia litoralis]|uniref:hypothetical protein n=1 Tax=Piscirickettsia litoralis TaxID=1891921 RepID=UPI001112F370|nr:hypothetical protein [Piscirickettsia litoralis]